MGWKGIFGFVLGSAITIILFMSKNPFLMFMAKLVDGELFIDEVIGKNENKKKIDTKKT